jgi:hypothetical protein
MELGPHRPWHASPSHPCADEATRTAAAAEEDPRWLEKGDSQRRQLADQTQRG